MRILFVTSNRIGDAVLSTGLLDHLLRTYPEARFTVACGKVSEGVFARMPRLERLISFDKRPRGMHWPPLWAATVGTWWDLVVDIRASALSWLVPARRRAIMRKRPGHKTEQLAAILRISPPPLPVAWTGPEDRALAERLLPEGPPVIALGPTANWDGKIWPPERFVELAHRLVRDVLPGARIAVFAGPGPHEAARAAPVLASFPEAIDLGGRLELPEAAACLARCALFVGNDSGLMHLAASAGCPTLGLFGASNPAEYAPAGRRTGVAISAGGGMAGLSVESALTAAKKLLGA
jgi:ADP-heptose:LPS heptosyltransferase